MAQDLSAADDASIIIHYYTGGSEVPSIYYWNGLPVDQETVWPGQPMTYEDENWSQYTFKDTNKINFLFTVGMNQSKDLTCKKGEWWYKDGKLYFLIQIMGKGTEIFSRKRAGDEILMMGPLGNGFKPVEGKCALLAGTAGIAPLLYLAKKLSVKPDLL